MEGESMAKATPDVGDDNNETLALILRRLDEIQGGVNDLYMTVGTLRHDVDELQAKRAPLPGIVTQASGPVVGALSLINNSCNALITGVSDLLKGAVDVVTLQGGKVIAPKA